MGTPEFSIPSLTKLIDNKDFDVVACYSREPSIANRGKKITKSPIHKLAEENNIKVITPKTLRTKESQNELRALNPDILVVVAYGLILPKEILEIPKLGCVNIHPSLLPKWRGAAPIQRPIMSGDNETGVAIMRMGEGLDDGNVINVARIDITSEDDYLSISEQLSEIGAELLVKSINEISQNKAKYTKQDDSLSTYANKLSKEECEINWQESALTIQNKIRGLRGTLTANFILNDEKIKIHKATIIDLNSTDHTPGKVINDNFEIQCGNGIIQPEIIQRPGKKAMTLKEFLLGQKSVS